MLRCFAAHRFNEELPHLMNPLAHGGQLLLPLLAQLGIAEDAQARQFVAGGVIERGDQAVVFGDVIRFAAKIFAEFKDALAIRRFDNHRV